MALSALAAFFGVVVLLGILGCRRFERWKSFGWVYKYEFREVSYGEYAWCVGDLKYPHLGGARRVWYAALSTRDSGRYDLWMARMPAVDYERFLRRNTVLKRDRLPDLVICPIAPERIPREWWMARAVEWWRPPPSPQGCRCHEWSDASGTVAVWSVYDEQNEILWLRGL